MLLRRRLTAEALYYALAEEVLGAPGAREVSPTAVVWAHERAWPPVAAAAERELAFLALLADRYGWEADVVAAERQVLARVVAVTPAPRTRPRPEVSGPEVSSLEPRRGNLRRVG